MLLIIREMQTKTAMRYHLIQVRMSIIKKSTNNNCWRGYGKKGAFLHCCQECKFVDKFTYSHYGQQYEGSLKNLKQSSHKFSSVHSFSCVCLFATPWTVARQVSLSITNSWSLLKLMSIKLVMPSSVVHFSCLQSFPASGSCPMSQFSASGGQSTGVSPSASVLPMNIPD